MTTEVNVQEKPANSKSNPKPSNAGVFISFRVPPVTYKEFERIAKAAYEMKAIKSPTVTALAKAALFTQANQFLGVEP